MIKNKAYYLFLKKAFPIICGLLVAGVHNIIDALFVSRGIDILAVGGINAVLPIQFLVGALTALIGSGSAVLITRYISSGENLQANTVFFNGFAVVCLLSVLLTLVFYYVEPYFLSLFDNVSQVKIYAKDYYMPITLGTFCFLLLGFLNDVLRSLGRTDLMGFCLSLSALMNIFLNGIFIFYFDLGLWYVGLATVIAQIISILFAIYFLLKIKKLTFFSKKNIFSKFIVSKLLLTGSSTFFGMLGIAAFIALINFILAHSSGAERETLVSAFGIVGRSYMFLLLPVMGVAITLQLFSGQVFFGEKTLDSENSFILNKSWSPNKNIAFLLTISIRIILVYSLSVTLVLFLCPEQFFSLFSDNENAISLCKKIAQPMFLFFFLACLNYTIEMLFQAMGRPLLAISLCFFRAYLFLIPCIFCFYYFFGINAIWYAFSVTDFSVFLISLYFLYKNSILPFGFWRGSYLSKKVAFAK